MIVIATAVAFPLLLLLCRCRGRRRRHNNTEAPFSLRTKPYLPEQRRVAGAAAGAAAHARGRESPSSPGPEATGAWEAGGRFWV